MIHGKQWHQPLIMTAISGENMAKRKFEEPTFPGSIFVLLLFNNFFNWIIYYIKQTLSRAILQYTQEGEQFRKTLSPGTSGTRTTYKSLGHCIYYNLGFFGFCIVCMKMRVNVFLLTIYDNPNTLVLFHI